DASPTEYGRALADSSVTGFALGVNSPVTKLRGFPETVAKTLGTPKIVAKAAQTAEHLYTPITNAETVSAARSVLKQGEGKALQYARTGTDTNAIATAMLLIDKYLKGGQYEKANQLIRDV